MAKENKKEISFVEGPIFQSLIRFALPGAEACFWLFCAQRLQAA